MATNEKRSDAEDITGKRSEQEESQTLKQPIGSDKKSWEKAEDKGTEKFQTGGAVQEPGKQKEEKNKVVMEKEKEEEFEDQGIIDQIESEETENEDEVEEHGVY